MNKTRSILSTLCFCFLLACAPQEKKKDGNECVVDFDKATEEQVEIKDIEYIPLETTEVSLLGFVDKVVYKQGKFYVLDRTNSGVYIFDQTGHFLSSICKPGEGPGEYLELMDMDVDDKGNVYIADNGRKEIICYQEANPERYTILPVNEHFKEFCVLDAHMFLLRDVFGAEGQKIKLALYDANKKSLNTLLEKKDESVNEMGILQCSKHYLYNSNGKIYYNERFTPFIYSISPKGELTKTYSIASRHYIPKEELKGLENKPQLFIQETKYIKDMVSIYENDCYFMCMPFIKPSATYLLVPKKSPQEAKRIDLMEIKELQGISQIEGVVNNRFLTVLNYSEELPEEVKQHPQLESVNEESNPILVLFDINIANANGI